MGDRVDQISQGVAIVGAQLTGIAWYWDWLGTNQPQVTALCGIIGAVSIIGGVLVNIVHKAIMIHLAARNTRQPPTIEPDKKPNA